MQLKKTDIFLPLLLGTTLAVGMWLGFKMKSDFPKKSFTDFKNNSPLQEIFQLINNKYVDTVNSSLYSDSTIHSLLNNLDPHTKYLAPKELTKANEEMSGNFFGIGVEYTFINDTMNIIHVLKDGPSFKAGLIIGDKLIAANNIDFTKKIPLDSIRTILRGKNNSEINLSIQHIDGNIENKKITRSSIPLTSVDASFMINENIAFIRLNKFSAQTYFEFMKELETLEKQGMKKLILDLRDNGGGYMSACTSIADEFLSGEKIITYTEGRKYKKTIEKAKRPGIFEEDGNKEKPLVVLCNESSASASEVLMGALQDWDRSLIIGQQTFGKGLVQEQFELSNGGALRLTVARYYTPMGRSLQRSYSKGEKEYYNEIVERMHTNKNNLSTDTIQSKKILSSKGRSLNSGIGIVPDIILEKDLEEFVTDSVMQKLITNSIVTNASYEIYLANRIAIGNLKSLSEFNSQFYLPSNWLSYYLKLTNNKNINFKALSQKNIDKLAIQTKAYIARIIWRNSGYFKIINNNDKMVQRAIIEINKL